MSPCLGRRRRCKGESREPAATGRRLTRSFCGRHLENPSRGLELTDELLATLQLPQCVKGRFVVSSAVFGRELTVASSHQLIRLAPVSISELFSCRLLLDRALGVPGCKVVRSHEPVCS